MSTVTRVIYAHMTQVRIYLLSVQSVSKYSLRFSLHDWSQMMPREAAHHPGATWFCSCHFSSISSWRQEESLHVSYNLCRPIPPFFLEIVTFSGLTDFRKLWQQVFIIKQVEVRQACFPHRGKIKNMVSDWASTSKDSNPDRSLLQVCPAVQQNRVTLPTLDPN